MNERKMIKFLEDLRMILHDNDMTLSLESDCTAFLAIKPKEGNQYTIMSDPMKECIIDEQIIDKMISKLENH